MGRGVAAKAIRGWPFGTQRGHCTPSNPPARPRGGGQPCPDRRVCGPKEAANFPPNFLFFTESHWGLTLLLIFGFERKVLL